MFKKQKELEARLDKLEIEHRETRRNAVDTAIKLEQLRRTSIDIAYDGLRLVTHALCPLCASDVPMRVDKLDFACDIRSDEYHVAFENGQAVKCNAAKYRKFHKRVIQELQEVK